MRNLLIFILCSLTISSFAQVKGLNPIDIKWQIMETPMVDIVYAKGMENQARRIANIVNYMDANNRQSVGDKKRKFDLVLQNRTVIPNGYVALAPFRSEFFATPPQSANFLGSMDWLDVLAIHEYRHAMQITNMKTGLGKLAYFVAGDQGLTITMGLAIPNWFFEGDAVITETTLTNAGRGRTPDFTVGQRAMAKDGVNYNYMKWRNGSFKDFVPNHYPLGYMMLTHLRNEYGNDLSGEIMREGASYRRIVYPYSRSMKKKTGLSTRQLFKDSWKKNVDEWNLERVDLDLTPSKRLTKEIKTVTSYHFPHFASENSFYATKFSFKETQQIVKVDEVGKETKIVDMGVNIDNYFDYKNGIFTWTEFSTGGRRSNESFSNLLVYKNGKKRQVTKRAKYFSPVIMDGEKLLAVEISSMQKSSLHVIDMKSGTVIKKHDIADLFIFRPTIIGNSTVAFIAKANSQLMIKIMNLEDGRSETVIGPTNHVMDGLEYHEGKLIFSASFSGIDNIYSLEIATGKLVQLTSVSVSANDPDISEDGKQILYKELSSKGRYISRALVSDNRDDVFKYEEPINMKWQDEVAAAAEGGNILDKIPNKEYESKKYNGLLRGMRLHSWQPGGSLVAPTFSVQMNNALDDASITALAGFNRNESRPFAELALRIAKYYPVVDFTLGSQGRSFSGVIDQELLPINFNENYAAIDVSIPYSRLRGNFTSTASLSVGGQYKYQSNFTADIEQAYGFSERGLILGEASVNYGIKRRTARQNLRSKLGAEVGLNYQYQLVGEIASAIVVTGAIYLPGLSKNHSLLVSGGHRILGEADDIIPFSNRFQYLRSINLSNSSTNVSRLSFDYALPLAYPDWGFAGILYLRRLKMNMFVDLGINRNPLEPRNRNSTGLEFVFDTKLLNLLEIPLGLQIGSENWGRFGGASLFVHFISSTNF